MGGVSSAPCAFCPVASDHEEDMKKGKRSRSVVIQVAPALKTERATLQPFSMDENHKKALKAHYRSVLMEQKPDTFHKTMLLSIQGSPKLNEIIACQMYCYRDLTKWPKLNKISQAQMTFFDKLIYQMNLNESAVTEHVYALGVLHFRYAQYGLKPHFLDLWRSSFEKATEKLKFPSDEDREEFFAAFRILNNYISDAMNLAYSRCQQDAAIKARTSI